MQLLLYAAPNPDMCQCPYGGPFSTLEVLNERNKQYSLQTHNIVVPGIRMCI